MTLPDDTLKSLSETLRSIHNIYNISYITLSLDSKEKDIDLSGHGISHTYLFNIAEQGLRPRKGGRAEMILRNLIAKLKVKYPLDEPKLNKTKKVTVTR